MTQEQLRMQMIAGIITEGQYRAMLTENEENTPEYNNFFQKFLDREYSMANDEYNDKEIIDSYRNKTITSLDDLVNNIAELDYDLTEEAGGYAGEYIEELKRNLKAVSDEMNFPYENELFSKLNKHHIYSDDDEEDDL